MSERLTKAESRIMMTWACSLRGTCDRLHTATTLWSPEPENLLLSGGYNGAPAGHPSCDEVGHFIQDNHCIRTNHGEENAILNCHNFAKLSGGTATVLGTPCYPCARKLVSRNIGRVEYIGSYSNAQGKEYIDELFKNGNVECIIIPIERLVETLDKSIKFSKKLNGGVLRSFLDLKLVL